MRRQGQGAATLVRSLPGPPRTTPTAGRAQTAVTGGDGRGRQVVIYDAGIPRVPLVPMALVPADSVVGLGVTITGRGTKVIIAYFRIRTPLPRENCHHHSLIIVREDPRFHIPKTVKILLL